MGRCLTKGGGWGELHEVEMKQGSTTVRIRINRGSQQIYVGYKGTYMKCPEQVGGGGTWNVQSVWFRIHPGIPRLRVGAQCANTFIVTYHYYLPCIVSFCGMI